MSRKGLNHEKDVSFICRITLSKDEKSLFDTAAEHIRATPGRARLGIGGTAAHLIRIALYCLGHHDAPSEIEAKRIGRETMKYLKEHHAVRVVRGNKLNKPNVYTINPDGSKTWDDE